jgi:hypothetical protein
MRHETNLLVSVQYAAFSGSTIHQQHPPTASTYMLGTNSALSQGQSCDGIHVNHRGLSDEVNAEIPVRSEHRLGFHSMIPSLEPHRRRWAIEIQVPARSLHVEVDGSAYKSHPKSLQVAQSSDFCDDEHPIDVRKLLNMENSVFPHDSMTAIY